MRDANGRFVSPSALAVTPPPPLGRAMRVTGRKVRHGKLLRVALYGDTHHPFHCEKTLSTVLQVFRAFGPHVVVDMGDGVDAGQLSKYHTDPASPSPLQQEIDAKRAQLVRFRRELPGARYYYLEGNHEERLRRVLWAQEGAARAVAQLRITQQSLVWPVLLGLGELGITWVPYDLQSSTSIAPKFILKHGSLIGSLSGYSATRELARYGRSGASGHSHRLGIVWRRDHHGQHVWVETGCCANLNPVAGPTPPGATDPNWQNGCVLLTFDAVTGAVAVEPVEIRNGHCIWRDKEYWTREKTK